MSVVLNVTFKMREEIRVSDRPFFQPIPQAIAHSTSAERSQADVFLTTDDRLFKKAQKNSQLINVKINNPVQWLASVIQAEESNDENPK